MIDVISPLDSDGDGLLDGEEEMFGTDPSLKDTDGDGLTDYEEARVYKTDPLKVDTDGDGSSDYDEIMAGTDPNDPNSCYKIIWEETADGNLILTFSGTLQESADGVGDWKNVSTVSPYTVTLGSDKKFYRARQGE